MQVEDTFSFPTFSSVTSTLCPSSGCLLLPSASALILSCASSLALNLSSCSTLSLSLLASSLEASLSAAAISSDRRWMSRAMRVGLRLRVLLIFLGVLN